MNQNSLDPKNYLRSLGVEPSKERGQNFLVDAAALDSIVQFGKPKKGEAIVEIGPGLGALTRELARGRDFTVIEIEPRFCELIKREFPEVTIIEEDVRLVDFSELGDELVVFGNLPYSFSTEIVFHLITFAPFIRRAVLLLQKEFAQRLTAEPGGRIYGALSVAAKLWANGRLGPEISGESFYPTTKVDSQLVELRFLSEPRFEVKSTLTFQNVVRASFFRRRKKILNSIVASQTYKDMDILKFLELAEISPDCRAETVSLEQYVRLSNLIEANVSSDLQKY